MSICKGPLYSILNFLPRKGILDAFTVTGLVHLHPGTTMKAIWDLLIDAGP